MYRLLLPLVATLILPAAAFAQHTGDVILSVPSLNGPIVTSGGEWTGQYAGRVFDEGIMPLTPPFTTGSPGFDGLAGTFPASSVIRLDFAKELLFWNGTAIAPPAVSITLDYNDTRSATISGSDIGGAAGFAITSVPPDGSFHVHIDYNLPSNALDGLYGVVLTLGPESGTTGFTTSESFLVTIAQGTFSDYQTGLTTMVDAAFAPVPEPSSIALAMVAAGGWMALRKFRKKGSFR